jgi:dCTP deaminase
MILKDPAVLETEDLSCYHKLSEYGLLSDYDIMQCEGMIEPFTDRIVREIEGRKILSYGLGSYGYDVRLSGAEFFIYNNASEIYGPDTHSIDCIDPKAFDKAKYLKPAEKHCDDQGNVYFLIPPYRYAMAVVEECLNMPSDVTAIGFGKSSYARVGVNTHITPIEAGWKGHLTVAMSNSTGFPAKVYVDEGLAQILFFRSVECRTSYEDRSGKYQNQGKTVTTAKV